MNKFFLILFLTLSSCGKSTQDFSMKGKTSDIPDSTKIFIRDLFDNRILDSTIVVKDKFEFNTRLFDSPLQVVLGTKDYKFARFAWIENNPMTFDATEGNFRYAEITGSEIDHTMLNLMKRIDTLSGEEKVQEEIQFVENHPNNLISAALLHVYSTTWGRKQTEELYKEFSSQNKNSKYGHLIKEFIEVNRNPQVGDHFVDFEMQIKDESAGEMVGEENKTKGVDQISEVFKTLINSFDFAASESLTVTRQVDSNWPVRLFQQTALEVRNTDDESITMIDVMIDMQ